MKTTIEIPDALLDRLRAKARRESTTLRQLVHAAIRQFLGTGATGGRAGFTLRDASVGGTGTGLNENDWATVRDRAYEGRGA